MQATLAPINRIPNGAWLAVHEAEMERERTARYLGRPKVVNAIYEPDRPAVQMAGLAALVLWHEDLRGEHDRDWLHL